MGSELELAADDFALEGFAAVHVQVDRGMANLTLKQETRTGPSLMPFGLYPSLSPLKASGAVDRIASGKYTSPDGDGDKTRGRSR